MSFNLIENPLMPLIPWKAKKTLPWQLELGINQQLFVNLIYHSMLNLCVEQLYDSLGPTWDYSVQLLYPCLAWN